MSAHQVAVTVVGADRPGIVAAVTKVLYERGCNLEDVSSTILRGHFSMMLIAGTPDDADAARLEEDLTSAGRDLGLSITVRAVDEVTDRAAQPTHVISVYGADRPGIVFRVAEALAAAGANITDLTSRVIGEDTSPVYAVLLEVSLDDDAALGSLEGLGDELGVDVSIHPVQADVL